MRIPISRQRALTCSLALATAASAIFVASFQTLVLVEAVLLTHLVFEVGKYFGRSLLCSRLQNLFALADEPLQVVDSRCVIALMRVASRCSAMSRSRREIGFGQAKRPRSPDRRAAIKDADPNLDPARR